MRSCLKRLLVFVLIVVLAAVLLFGLLSHRGNDSGRKLPSLLGNETQQGESADDWYHFLLIGTDTRPNEDAAGRSDTMIIASVNQARGKVKLASLARDTWVSIPGKGENKLNAAHSWGGPDLLLETINQNFDMHLTDYVSVDFYGLIDIVDAMGGVEVEITKAEASAINSSVASEHPRVKVTRVKAGNAQLCGVQALSYARIRKLDNDFGRTSRQRKLIGALLEKARRLNLLQLMSVFEKGMNALTYRTEKDPIQLVQMFTGLKGGIDSMEELSLPSEGHYRYVDKNGVSAVGIDPRQVAQEWHDFVYGQ